MAQPTKLRFGDIVTDIVNIDFYAGTQFAGTVSWGPDTDIVTGPTVVSTTGDPDILQVDSGSVSIDLPQPYKPPTGNWEYFSEAVTLGPLGVSGEFSVQLPEELIYKSFPTEPWYNDSPIDFPGTTIDQDLVLESNPILGDNMVRVKIEGQPFSLELGSVVFQDSVGFTLTVDSFDYIHDDEIAEGSDLRGANDGYLANGIEDDGFAVITPDGLNVEVESDGAQNFLVGFPHSMLIGLAEYSIAWVDSELQPGSQMTSGAVATEYNTDSCSGGAAMETVFHGPATFDIGTDGALLGAVDNSGETANNYEFDAFSIGPIQADGTVYVPGFITLGEADSPQSYVLAGRVDVGLTDTSFATDGETEYSEGDGFYAGYNLSRSQLTGTDFSMILACNNAPFSMSDANKLYYRHGGFSGTLEASESSVSALPPLDLYNEYETVLTKFNYTILDNKQHYESQIDGMITLPFPSDIDLVFESLEIDACGAPGGAQVVQPAMETLAYWNRDFSFSSLDFRSTDPPSTVMCQGIETEVRTLWTNSTNVVPNLPVQILMETNFAGDGDILDATVLGEPSTTLQDYFFAIRSVYYTSYEGGMALEGRTVVVGDMELPFWGATPVVALWDIGVAPQLFDGRAYAQTPVNDIDPDNNGFPNGINSIQDYLDDPDQRPQVRGSFANIIQLTYRVKYDNISQRFATVAGEESGRDLVVVDVFSNVRGITKDDTEILFGLSYAGLPVLNLSSIVGDLADPAIEALLMPLKNAMDAVNEKLSGSLAEALKGPLEDVTRPVVTPLVNDLRAIGEAVPSGSVNANLLKAEVSNQIGNIEQELEDALNSSTGPIVEKIDEALTALEDIIAVIEGLDTNQITAILEVLIELAGADSSGASMVFDELNSARNYIVDVLIGENLKPALIEIRNIIGNPGQLANLEQIQDLVDGAEFPQMVTQIENKINDFLEARAGSSASIRNLDPEEVNTFIVETILNTAFTQSVNQVVAQVFEPLRQQAQNTLNGFFDTLNNQLKAYLDQIGGALNNVTAAFNDVAGVGAAEMSGYAVFGGQSLDRLHIDAAFDLAVPDNFGFRGALDMERFKNDSDGVVCGTPAGAESIRITIGVFDLPINVPRGSLTADIIELSLRLNSNPPMNPEDPPNFYLSDIAGRIETTGAINFEAVKILSPAFAAGVGENETFIAFRGSVVFNAVSMRGGIFLGRTCNAIELLSSIDPEIDGVITDDELTGIYTFGEAAIPIVDYGCFLRVGATAGAGFWLFVEGPTIGGKLTAGVYGEGVCLISVRGKIVLIGGKNSKGFFFKGTGWVAGGIGFCEPETWFTIDEVWADKWCAACVLYLDVIYNNDWTVDYGADCKL